jgi:membrane protein DedA with SNARE-associated domain/rhodanese-related sulfurtransferase
MTSLLLRYGLALVFVNVLLAGLGVPVPAVPTLVVAGGLAKEGHASAWVIFAVAFGAAMIGDLVWYAAGRIYGHRVMRLLCRMSLSPDSCVRQSEHQFQRWGRLTIVLAKFIPGISMITPPLAGALRFGWWSFSFFDGLGTALWAGLAIGGGVLFQAQIDRLVDMLRVLTPFGLAGLGVLLAGYIALKWWQRRRFYKQLRMARITADELDNLVRQGPPPIIVDLRSAAIRAEDGRSIPGAVAMDYAELDEPPAKLALDRDIVFYCSCPNDAGAAYAARKLMDQGYTRVRPLFGGIDAWIAAGYAVDAVPLASSDPAPAAMATVTLD